MDKLKNINLVQGLIIVAAIGGLSAPLAKFALGEIPVFSYSFVRLLMAAFLMLATLRVMKRRPKWSNFMKFAPIASFWWINAIAFTAGLNRTDATTAEFLHISIPMLTALAAFFILKERLGIKQWFGSIIALVGVGVIMVNGDSLSFESSELRGNILVMVSALALALYSVLSKQNRYKKIRAIEMVFIAATCGAIINLPIMVFEYYKSPWIGTTSLLSILALIAGAVVIALYYVGFQSLIRRFGATVATTNLYLLPVAVVLWSFIILHEVISLSDAIGACIVLFGVLICTRVPSKKKLSNKLASVETLK